MFEDERNRQNRSRDPRGFRDGPPGRQGYPGPSDYSRQQNGRDVHNSTGGDRYGNEQFRTRRDDSGLGRDLDSPMDYSPTEDRFRSGPERGIVPQKTGYAQTLPPGMNAPSTLDRSPDSGVSDTDDMYRSKSRPLQRRKTLPSIVKQGRPATPGGTPQGGDAANKTAPGGSVAQGPRRPGQEETDTYIIENGIRKRVKAEVYHQPTDPTSSAENLEKPQELPSRYKLETPSKLRKGANRGSLPDVSACKEMEEKGKIMGREEVHVLSQQRREELRRLREEAERRRQQEIVLRLGDLKDWCQQRQLLMLVITLNVTLATMFFNLLSQ